MTIVARVPLGEIATLQAGVGFPLDLQGRSVGDYPLAKVGDISRAGRSENPVLHSADHFVTKEDLDRLRLDPIPEGSVLFAKIGEAIRQNHRVVAGRPMLIDNNAMAAIPTSRVDGRYLYQFLRTIDFYALASSTTVPSLRKSELSKVLVPLPQLPEQRRIAEILDRADALRAKRRAALTELDTLTESLFLDMFGDPATNPRGFPKKPLLALVRDDDTINYGVVQPGDDLDQGIPLIRVGDLTGGGVSHAALKKISPLIEGVYKRSRLRGNEILVSCVGSIGVVAIADESVRGFNIARAVARIPVAEATNRVFLAAHLRTKAVQRFFISELRTVSQPTLNIRQLSETTIVLPPIELQRVFALRVEALEAAMFVQRTSLMQCDALFASLQQEAFLGRL